MEDKTPSVTVQTALGPQALKHAKAEASQFKAMFSDDLIP
jgi:hypothetical protein